MNTKQNDKMYRQIMKAVKARQEMAKYATTDAERVEDEKAIVELLAQAKTLTGRI